MQGRGSLINLLAQLALMELCGWLKSKYHIKEQRRLVACVKKKK